METERLEAKRLEAESLEDGRLEEHARPPAVPRSKEPYPKAGD